MRFVDTPTIYVIARQYLDEGEVARFLKDEHTTWKRDTVSDDESAPWLGDGGDGEYIAEFGGRLCYLSFGKAQYRTNTSDYLKNILQQRHYSVLEHAVWTVVISGVSRSLTHELIRHRHLSPSQLSQRYVDETEANMIVPPLYQTDPELRALWEEAVGASQAAYARLVERTLEKHPNLGATKREQRIVARQAARSVLPNATETKIQITANATALRHVLRMRGAPDAEVEIRQLAIVWGKLMQREAPALFSDMRIYPDHLEFA